MSVPLSFFVTHFNYLFKRALMAQDVFLLSLHHNEAQTCDMFAFRSA